MRTETSPLTATEKLILVVRIWRRFMTTYLHVRREPLPTMMQELSAIRPIGHRRVDARKLGRIVQMALRFGPWKARCLWTALVLYALLREQGDSPQLVIGLRRDPKDKDAHAWVEVEGVDVGPPPGGRGHEELTRYG